MLVVLPLFPSRKRHKFVNCLCHSLYFAVLPLHTASLVSYINNYTFHKICPAKPNMPFAAFKGQRSDFVDFQGTSGDLASHRGLFDL